MNKTLKKVLLLSAGISCLLLASFVVIPRATQTLAVAHSGYKVYNSQNQIEYLTPTPQRPLYFFATWCKTCKEKMPNATDKNYRYVYVGWREETEQGKWDSIREFIKNSGADSDLTKYYVSVEKKPTGIEKVPTIIDGEKN